MIWIRKSSTSTWREIHHWIDPKSPVRMPGSPKQGGRTIQDWDFRDSWIVYLFFGDHQSPRGIQIALRIPYCGWAYGHQKSRVLTHSRGCLVDTLTSIWRFPKIGLPPNHPFNRIHDFPWNKPSSYGGTPPFMETPIWLRYVMCGAQSVAGPSAVEDLWWQHQRHLRGDAKLWPGWWVNKKGLTRPNLRGV